MSQPRYQATVRIDATQRAPLRRIWRYVGYDEPNYTYTPRGRELLGKLGPMADAPYYVRAHFLLCSGDGQGRPKWGSTNVYTEGAAGSPIYDFAIVDRIFDTILECGGVPFVELGFTPEALTTAPAGTPYDDVRVGGWRYPPRDYAKWQDLVRALAAHCLARYGQREVDRWYWELWNEPDIFYWAGTPEEYFRLYDHTAAGLVAALPRPRVGGPATTNPGNPNAGQYLRAFLEHCARGENAVTGGRGARLDFVSFHTKGASLRREPDAPKQTPTLRTLVGHVAAGLGILADFPEFHGAEVILSECDPDGWAAGTRHDNPNLEYRNSEYYASFVAESVVKLVGLDGYPNRVDGLLTWAFEFEDRPYFEGLRTLSTNGVDKPVLSVFRALGRLGGARLALTSSAARDPLALPFGDEAATPPDVSGLAASGGSGEVQVFLVSHHDDWDARATTEVAVEVSGLEGSRAYRVRRYLVDQQHGNAHTVWKRLGEPQAPSAAELAAMTRAAEMPLVAEETLTARQGGLRLALELPAHAVCLIELVPEAGAGL